MLSHKDCICWLNRIWATSQPNQNVLFSFPTLGWRNHVVHVWWLNYWTQFDLLMELSVKSSSASGQNKPRSRRIWPSFWITDVTAVDAGHILEQGQWDWHWDVGQTLHSWCWDKKTKTLYLHFNVAHILFNKSAEDRDMWPNMGKDVAHVLDIRCRHDKDSDTNLNFYFAQDLYGTDRVIIIIIIPTIETLSHLVIPVFYDSVFYV